MKPTLVLLLMATMCCADNLTTLNGITYSNCSVSRVEPDAVTVVNSRGVHKLMFSELSNDVRRQYGYDEDRALKYLEMKSVTASNEMVRTAKARQLQQAKDQEWFKEQAVIETKAKYDNDYRKATQLGFRDEIGADRVAVYRKWKERGSKRNELPGVSSFN